MRCENCGCQAPTCYVEFYQNIGALIMRFSKSIKGNLCKSCINEHFVKFTLITAAVGLAGDDLVARDALFLVNNIVYYCLALKLKRVQAKAPVLPSAHPTMSLTPRDESRLEPFRGEIQTRLNSGEDLNRITFSVGPRAGLSAVQVELFIEKMKTSGSSRPRGQLS